MTAVVRQPEEEMGTMQQQVEETARDAILVEDAARIRVMGFPILEALPSSGAPYQQVDPFILVHEARIRLSGQPGQIPVRQEGDAIVRVLVGEGAPVRLGTPALILDVELPTGGQVTTPVPPGFQGFAYVLEGEAAFGANRRRARPAQLVLLGPGEEFAVTGAAPGTRFLLMTGQPYGEVPVFNGPFVD
jgi:Pirin C-terminal cupin domain